MPGAYDSSGGEQGAYGGSGGDAGSTQEAIQFGVRDANTQDLTPEQKKKLEAEESVVKKLLKEYEDAREFDKQFRQQAAIDRRYAAGTQDLSWAVSTNLVGSFIDILTSFLYARNPDVSGKKAEQVDNSGTKEMDDFAKTLELVVSRLWKKSRLKSVARKQVRSSLSNGEGWFKAVMFADKPQNPKMEKDLQDLRDNIERLAGIQNSLKDVEGASTEDIDCQVTEQQELIGSLENKIEATIRKTLAIDFVPTQNIQVSLDVDSTEDHLDANWNANAIFILKSELQAKFPRLTEQDIKGAACYYQKPVKELQPMPNDSSAKIGVPGSLNADDADNYVKSTSSTSSNQKGPEFGKIIELWDKRTNHIKTMLEGCNKWAVEPYEPNYASSRFYPYFRLAFFEVDGSRHPQSLSWRIRKLQDEYCAARSGTRITRERSIPAVLFNSEEIDKDDAKKIKDGVHAEMIGISPTTKDKPLSDCFAAKPVVSVDFRLFDTQAILADMEKLAGVQEALQSSVSTPKTATEAGIQQSGFAARTTADRDSLEDMLDDLANYTAEVALGALGIQDARRIAGNAAYWPTGMSIDDLVTMVEVEIKAGTTGKPRDEAARQAWGVILPVLKESIMEIQTAQMTGNIALAKALSELVKETMTRMGDDTDPERFIPAVENMPPAPPVPGLPAPGDPNGGAPLPGGPTPSLPPSDEPKGPGALSPPHLENPNLQPPNL